jgi:hypothetical protein
MRTVLAVIAVALTVAPAAEAQKAASIRTASTTRAVTIGDTASCRENTAKTSGFSLAGRKLWTYFQWVRFCYTGSPWIEGGRIGKVTTIARNRWGETYALGWDYDPMGATIWRSDDGYEARVWSQGKFRLCGPFCVQTKTPWIRHYLFGNGRIGIKRGG